MQVLPFHAYPNYEVDVPIEGASYTFVVRWNERSAGWSFDVLEADGTKIIEAVRIVLGTNLGRRCSHPLFRRGVFLARSIDRSRTDPGFDDLGKRVFVVRYTAREVQAIRLKFAPEL